MTKATLMMKRCKFFLGWGIEDDTLSRNYYVSLVLVVFLVTAYFCMVSIPESEFHSQNSSRSTVSLRVTGDQLNQTFPIEIVKTKNVTILKKMIREESPNLP